MLVLVDGAHGLLANDVDLNKMATWGVDFYVTNGHKWMATPRGVAMLYCPDEGLRETVLRQPAVISHGIDDGYFSRFLWDGCRDYAAQLALPVVIDFWDRVGVDWARGVMKNTLREAVARLAEKWYPSSFGGGSEVDYSGVTLVPMSLHSPMVRMDLHCIRCVS